MSLQGLQDHRNGMVTIEIEWQTALCFAHGCFHILDSSLLSSFNPLMQKALAD